MKINLKEHPICSSKTRQRFRKLIKFVMRVSFFYTVITLFSMQLLLAHHEGMSQGIESIYVTIELKNENLKTLIDKIEEQTNVRFAYLESEIGIYANISLPKEQRSVKYLLDEVIGKGTMLTYSQVSDNYIIIRKKENNELTTPPNEDETGANADSPFFTVSGTVTDASTQQPLPGVNVIVKNTTKGTTTDAGGKFSIDAEDNDVLVFSFIGFTNFETTVNGRTSIDVAMNENATGLDEVVVNAGYWNVKDSEKTGNISRVTADEIANQPVTNPLTALQGRMPGVYIQQTSGVPGTSVNVQIRGRNSLNNGNNPLYVIDGVPFSSQPLSSEYLSNIFLTNGVSPFNSINPSDIESIEVLKDADATAVYGSRGANGVVLITTKKGKEGKTKFDVRMTTGVGKVTRLMDMLNTQEYVEMRKEAFANDGTTPNSSNAVDLIMWDTTRYTNWQKELLGGTAKTTNIQASLSGGNANTKFFVSGGYYKETTVFPTDQGFTKGSTHLSVNHTSNNKKLTSNFSISYVSDKNDLPYNDLTQTARRLAPNAPALYDENGELNWENNTWTNPLASLRATYESTNNNLIGNAVFGYEIIPGLQVKTNLGYNSFQLREMMLYPNTVDNPNYGSTSANSYSQYNDGYTRSWIIEPQINFDREIASGKLTAIVGTTFQDQKSNQRAIQGYGYANNALIKNVSAASTKYIFGENSSIYRYNGFFARLNYIWNEKYILNLTGRRDGSSRFGPDKQFANFGAIGAAWIFSNESWIKNNLSFLSFGKLRTSYGTSGNDQIGNYQFLDTYTTTETYQGSGGLRPTRLANPDFAWEVNKKFESGLELAFIEDRIFLSTSYFRNRSSNQLVDYKLPLTTGFNSIQYNLDAVVQNSGWEVVIRSHNIRRNSFTWTTEFNITVPKNKLVSFPGLESSTYAQQFVVGEPLSIVKRYHYLGVDPQTGVYQFEDMDDDGAITTADRLSIKNIGQDYFGGLNNTIIFKGWQIDFFVQIVKQTGQNYLAFNVRPGQAFNIPDLALNRWQNEGDEKPIQRYTTGTNAQAGTGNTRLATSDITVSDASFVRLKNVSIAYHFPEEWTKGISCRLYVQGQNLLTFTNYKAADPESQNFNRLPPLRIYTAGLQITF